MLNCSVILEGSAQKQPQLPAAICGPRTLTYGELNEAACKLANALARYGVEQGDKVMLACPNLIEFLIAYYGILKAGALVVPVNILSKKNELAYIMEDTETKVFLCFEGTDALPIGREGWEAFREKVEPKHLWFITADPRSPSPYEACPTLAQMIAAETSEWETVQVEPQHTAVILYTSGTTGKPKGAELTHQNILTCALAASKTIETGPRDTHLITLPMFHCFAQTCQMNSCLLAGAKMVLLPRFDPDEVLRSMEAHEVTVFCGVPTMYWALLQHPNVEQYDLAKIRKNFRIGVSGGAPLPVETLRKFEEKFEIPILEGYGLSETSAMTTFNPIHGERKVGTTGVPVWGVAVKIVNEAMEEVPRGEKGEVVISGHVVMKGYLNRPESTKEALRGGWFHTGDVGIMDEDGYLSIVDRTKDMILRGGFNVYPREVEEILLTHPDITLAAVIGVPDDHYGEEVKAFVILRNGATATSKEIIEWAKGQMAGYKYPRIVEVRQTLPLTATGKVVKTELRQ